ncbi:hypothetical protein RZS28_15935 [Methylocapsa polymorpha]|uniref:Uncharacterized protein n=1 Tax=Methylocapsa polymorpha TaxID=3080828 RepID=A0ABZ0HR47_9HYPH|nr:hypothetical protein RZS28_15935 [Methylocapsa sp. RX1]
MSISAISAFGAQALYASRSSANPPVSQPQTTAPSQPPVKPAEVNAGHDGDSDDHSVATANSSTLASVNAAYASN